VIDGGYVRVGNVGANEGLREGTRRSFAAPDRPRVRFALTAALGVLRAEMNTAELLDDDRIHPTAPIRQVAR
jgi:hypothetical protein